MKLIIQYFVIYSILNTIHCDDCDKIPNLAPAEKCCDSPNIVKLGDEQDCETTSMLKWAECYFKKINASTDSQPNVNEFKKYAKPLLEKSSGWETIFNKAMDKCMAEVMAKDAETRKRLSKPPYNLKDVNSVYLHLLVCLELESLLECPAANRDKSAQCNEITDYVKRCGKEFPPRFLLAHL